jgi:hypothetical protein
VEAENRIKEQQLCLFANRAISSKFSANQLRLCFSAIAYVLMNGTYQLSSFLVYSTYAHRLGPDHETIGCLRSTLEAYL